MNWINKYILAKVDNKNKRSGYNDAKEAFNKLISKKVHIKYEDKDKIVEVLDYHLKVTYKRLLKDPEYKNIAIEYIFLDDVYSPKFIQETNFKINSDRKYLWISYKGNVKSYEGLELYYKNKKELKTFLNILHVRYYKYLDKMLKLTSKLEKQYKEEK